jgi:iron complex outermembrane receptor protein
MLCYNITYLGDDMAGRRAAAIALISLPLLEVPAYSQAVELPAITVTASPIVRRPVRPVAAPGPRETAPETPFEAPPPALSPDLYQGTLPIVTDQFATVTVMPRGEIDRSTGQTLGEILQEKPGITSSGFAAGSASRPIIRGLDNYRVRIQENGIGSSGVSEIGEDHAVPLDPLAAQSVEVIRGPATLRYGSQAIGGVVNAENNRIPTMIPRRGLALEGRGALTSVNTGRDGALLLDAGAGNVALHADVWGRSNGAYAIPSYPYLFPEEPAPFVGRWQPNSWHQSNGNSIGGSFVFDRGFVGAAYTKIDSLYGIPGQEATETRTNIDMRQEKFTSKGEYRPDSYAIDAIRYWFGSTDYRHAEIADEGGFYGPQQHFLSNQKEGRAEIQFRPLNLRFAALTTALGLQMSREKLDAPGVEGGLFDPNSTRSVAGYMFNELRFNDTQRMQLAGRIESNVVKGSVPDLFVDETVTIWRDRAFTPKSGAIGFLQDLPGGLVASVTAQHVERAPRAPELFSRGVHEATGTFDIGNPNLDIEVAHSIEAGLRRAQGPFRFEATAFYTRFNGFIYRNLTGQSCDEDFASCAPGDAGELLQAVYDQRNATFRGAEVQAQYDVAPLWRGVWGIDGRYDIVRATFTDGSNVPRIPPQRLGGGVYYRDGQWFARVGILHAFPQNDISDFETETGGYDLVKAELSYTMKLPFDPSGISEAKFGIVGDNLLNDDVRFAQSFKKDEVLQPGRTVKVFATVKF